MVLEIIEEVVATASKNKKLEILNSHKGNELLKRVIQMAYDPFLNFWIKKIPDYEYVETLHTLEEGLDLLGFLSNRTYTGNEGILHLKFILSSLDPDDAVIIERIIGKDMRAGFSAGTANKVWGKNFIMEWPVMLCSPFDQKLVDKMEWPAITQLKLDGLRVSIVVKDNKVEYRTRNGKPMDLLGVLDEPFIKMAQGKHWVYDGELLVLDLEGNPLPRQTGNGIIVRAQKGLLSQADANCIATTLWDLIDGEAFIKGFWKETYATRFTKLALMIDEVPYTRIALVEEHLVENIDQCLTIVNGYVARGLEGAILKNLSAPWEDHRSRSQIKFKSELDCDLVCVGLEEGTGKYSGKLGALILESSDGKIRTNCGSGFNDLDRENIGPNIIGKIISVKYNARITKKGSETDSLFLPIFKCVRDASDKSEADSSTTIK